MSDVCGFIKKTTKNYKVIKLCAIKVNHKNWGLCLQVFSCHFWLKMVDFHNFGNTNLKVI